MKSISIRNPLFMCALLGLVGCANVVRQETSTNSTGSSGTSSGGGACERDCQGQPCIDGLCAPEILVSDLYYTNRLAVDASRVYWTSADGTIKARSTTKDTIETLISGQAGPTDIAVDSSGIYWTDSDANTIHSMPLNGGPTALLAETGNPLGIVVHNGTVYVTNTYDKLSNDEQIVRIPLPAGPSNVISTSLGAYMLAVDDTRVVWTDRASGSVWTAPITGGDAMLLAGDLVQPLEIEMDADAAYVTTLEATIRIPLKGGTPEALVSGPGRGLAMDATHIYVGTADGRILKVAKTGGGAIELSKTALYADDIAVNDQHVYWITRAESGLLLRTNK
jgi:hypothetical protein